MFHKKRNSVSLLILLFLKIKLNFGAVVNNTNVSQAGGQPVPGTRFGDIGPGGMGYPNFPQMFGNSPDGFPGNGFPPFGNQNNMMQPSPQNFGWDPSTSQGFYPNRPDQSSGYYPGNQGNYPTQQGPNNARPGLNVYDGDFNPDYNNMNQNPNYQGQPNNNRPYQNGEMPFNQGGYPNRPDDIMPPPYPTQNGQYGPQGNYQGNPNYGPGGANPNSRPMYPDTNMNGAPNTNIVFPGNTYQNQLNYPNQNGMGYQGGGVPPYISHNMHRPGYDYNPGNDGSIQFPDQDINQGNNLDEAAQGSPGQFGDYGRPSANNQSNSINGPNVNDTSSNAGKPVFNPSATVMPSQGFNGSSQTQCVQDCRTTSEYDPVCGTNSVTYLNEGKLICAQKCGLAVSIRQRGRCAEDTVPNKTQG